MVWRKRGSKRPAKRAGGRRRRFVRKSKYLRGGSGKITALKTLTVPDKLIVKLPYHGSFTLSDALGAATQTMNLNSIYDPDRTGIGHQPLGYDQWNVFYNRYRVIGAKVTVRACNQAPSACQLGIIGMNTAGLVLASEATWEQPHMTSVVLSGAQGGLNAKTLTKYFYNPRITGVSGTQYRGSDQYAAAFGANPSEIICANIYAQQYGPPSGTPLSVQMNVDIVYYVELFDRNVLALSSTNPLGPEGNNDHEAP